MRSLRLRKEIRYSMFVLVKKAFSIGVCFLFLFIAPITFAQESAATDSPEMSVTPTPAEYLLPYPGLLPDSPLYFAKTFRDRVIDFLISDSIKKAEFDLLQADKRLNSGFYLIMKRRGKEALAESTISKGQNYFEQAIAKTKEAQKQGLDTKKVVEKLSFESKKQQKRFGDLTRRLEKLQKQVDILR